MRSRLLLLALAACGGGEVQEAQQQPAEERAPLGLQPWYRDFPYDVRLSPRRAGQYYDRTRRQAIESLVAKLQGNTTKEAWAAAKEFFWRAPEEAVEPLIEAMDRAYQIPAMSTMVQNTVEAMGRMNEERFDEALRRALEHPTMAVRQAAFAALAHSGRRETVVESYRYFLQMDGKARAAWLHAARVRLGADCVPFFRELMGSDLPELVLRAVLKETLEMAPEQAAEVLRGRWNSATGEFKTTIAGILHATGDVAGTLWLRERMRGGVAGEAKLAVEQASRGDLELLMDEVLALSIHPSAEVRLAVLRAIAELPGPNITNTLEVLAQDTDWQVRSLALKGLTDRGYRTQVDLLLEDLETATGTRLQLILNLLTASGDPRAVPVLLQRYRSAAAGESRPFLRAIAYSGTLEGFEALARVFLEDEHRINDPEQPVVRTTWNYIPILMLNIRGGEDAARELFARLPREDYVRRSLMLSCLVSMAADRTDQGVVDRLWRAVNDVAFDRTEIPQMRLLALGLLVRKALTLDDVMALRSALPEEDGPMQMAISDFLFEFF